MSGKIIKHGMEVKQLIKNGVNKLATTVGYTLGPKGRNVSIFQSWGAPHTTKDGITVAKSIYFSDQFENFGAQMIRQAAQKSVEEAGDGTTTSTILAQAIFNEGLRLMAADFNPIDLKKGIECATKLVVKTLDEMSKPIETHTEIEQVASISANDQEIGRIIAEAVDKVGKDGVITIDESSNPETVLNISEGMSFDRGYYSPFFVNNTDKVHVEFNNCLILIHEDRIEDVNSVLPILSAVAGTGKQLLIIAEDYSQIFITTLLQNKMKGVFASCPVKAPGFGDRRKEILRDLSVLTGATFFSKELSYNDVSKCQISDLGQATKVVVNRNETIIVGGRGNKDELEARINQIRDDIANVDNDYDRSKMKERLAKLVGGIAIVRVGAQTEAEMKEKKDRVEDAMHATRAAVEEGIVPGGGLALLKCCHSLSDFIDDMEGNDGQIAGAKAVLKSLDAPMRLIISNAGKNPDITISYITGYIDTSGFGYNAAIDEFGDLFEMGVIDPKKVVRLALQNAASVAIILLTTEAIVGDEKPVESIE